MKTIISGPFTFVEGESGGCECWDVKLLEGSTLPRFCVKNYGGEPVDTNPFSGWRVVAGGPFTSAGGWTSRAAAIEGATPWLVTYYKAEAARRLEEAKKLQQNLEDFLSGLNVTKG